ncbi:ATP-binding protein [Desulfovibrio sp. OttesenSCG-928-C14]|nr:ATP-binding protein [Desulfovibrio sp. OttesenSCG-928-C14]
MLNNSICYFLKKTCPNDVLFKHLLNTDKINFILSDVYNAAKTQKTSHGSREAFIVRGRKELRANKSYPEELFSLWTIDRVISHIESENVMEVEDIDMWDILLFHLLGLAYDIPAGSYPSEIDCIRFLDGEPASNLSIHFYTNAIVVLDGLLPLNEMRREAQEYKEIFEKLFLELTSLHIEFQTINDIVEAREKLKSLCDVMSERGEFLKKLQQCIVRSQRMTNIPLSDDIFSPDRSVCLAAVEAESQAYEDALFHFLQNNSNVEYTSDMIRETLSAFIPPLRARDSAAMLFELERVENGFLRLEDTYIVRIIFPVVKGEKSLSVEDEECLGEDFSANFVRDLKEGRVSIQHLSDSSEHMESFDPEKIYADENIESSFNNSQPATAEQQKQEHQKLDKIAPYVSESVLELEDRGIGLGQVPLDTAVAMLREEESIQAETCLAGNSAAVSTSDACLQNILQSEISQEKGGEATDPVGVDIELSQTDADSGNCAARVWQLTEELLSSQRSCELYWLMKETPHPEIPVWLAELLYLGTRLQPGFTSSQARIKSLIEEGETHYVNKGAFSVQMSMLLAASLIRPTLMMPSILLKSLLDKIIEPLVRYHCEPLLLNLGTFAARGVALSDAIFMNLSLISQGQKRREELERRTKELLTSTSSKKTSFQRATAVVRELFSPRGELGKVLHACLDNDYSDLGPSLQKRWDDKAFLGKVVNELDEQVNKSTKAARKIDYKAFDAIWRDAVTAKQLLVEWDELQRQGSDQVSDKFSHKQLNTIAEQAYPDRLPETAYATFLKTQLDELRAKFNTSIASDSSVDPLEELAVWPIALGEAEFSSEGFYIPLEALLQYLETTTIIDKQVSNASLLHHIHEGHFTAVERYLSIYPQHKTNEVISLCNEQIQRWEVIFEEREDSVLREIGNAYLRGVIQESQDNDLVREVADIANQQRQKLIDLHQAVGKLDKIRARLHDLEAFHKSELHTRLNEVRKDITVESAQGIGVLIESGEYVQAYDALAQVYDVIAGRPGSSLPAAPPLFATSDVENFFSTLKKGTITPPPKQSGASVSEAWEHLRSGKTRGSKGNVRYISELLRWFGFSLDQNVTPSDSIVNEGRPSFWNGAQYEMTINCPIPQWGSLAGKRHTIVMGWPPQPDFLQQLLKSLFTEKSKKLSRNQPITIFWFGSLSNEQRIQLVQQCRSNSYLPVVIDNNLFYWLQSLETSERRTQALFNVALAGSPCNPYTPNAAGAVPREMFFGREKDIEALWDPFGPCVVYGGRQLGKSALLFQVKNRHHNEEMGQYVLIHSMRQTDSSLIEAALQEMRRAKILSDRTTRNTFSNNIKDFLDKDPNRRILFLFDECDAILDQDAKTQREVKAFPELTEFRDLMVKTGRRFKIVLTGLHSVQRFSRIPNSPLPHFGDPLCVGPLQPEAATALVRHPMECLGLKFADPTLVGKILTHTNYHPSLIQLFCEELVKSMGSKASSTARLPVVIDGDIIAQVYKKADLRAKIRQRFDWTLALDQRYRVIGYTLALWELTEAQNSLGAGMRIPFLMEELRNTWPEAFSHIERDGVESLLEEMVGLGLVSQVGSMFRLRTPNIIHLLGGDENILSELEQFHSMPYNKEGLPEAVRTVLFNKQPDPLVVAQHNILKSRQGGLILVVGTKALGLDRVPETLEHINHSADEESDRKGVSIIRIKGTNTREIMHLITTKNKEIRDQDIISWLDAREVPDPLEALCSIQDWQYSLRTDKKFVKMVCLIDAADFLELQEGDRADKLVNSTSTQIIFLHRWTKASLEDWYHQTSMVPPDSLESILQKTGGWDACVMAHFEGKSLPELSLSGFTFPDTPQINDIVNILIEYGDVSEEDLLDLMPRTANLDALLELLMSLGVLTRSREEMLSIEPCLAANLKKVSE